MKHCSDGSSDFTGIEQAVKGLVAAQVSLGKELFKIASSVAGDALSAVGGLKLPKGSSCCDIPEPCWMPISHGPAKCALREGGSGEIWLSIVNEDFQPHSYAIAVKGADAGLVKVSTNTLTLGPKESGEVQAIFAMPASASKAHYEVVLWVVGCRAHYVRWEIDRNGKNDRCCQDVSISDQPDYVVHWYDHFYCARPCMGRHAHAVLDDGA
jgi:hypothetical protein